MNLSQHAELRSAQRTLSEDELSVLNFIGIEFEQKGGTTLVTISKSEKPRWLNALREALFILNTAVHLDKHALKKKRKTIKRLVERLSAKSQPFIVVNPNGDTVITCGYHYSRRLNRNN